MYREETLLSLSHKDRHEVEKNSSSKVSAVPPLICQVEIKRLKDMGNFGIKSKIM